MYGLLLVHYLLVMKTWFMIFSKLPEAEQKITRTVAEMLKKSNDGQWNYYSKILFFVINLWVRGNEQALKVKWRKAFHYEIDHIRVSLPCRQKMSNICDKVCKNVKKNFFIEQLCTTFSVFCTSDECWSRSCDHAKQEQKFFEHL